MRKHRLKMSFTLIIFSLMIVLFLYAPNSQREPLPAKKKTERKREEKKDRPGEAIEYLVSLRSEVGKPFSYSGSWRFEAYREAKQKAALHKDNKTYSWIERGPANVGGRSRSIVVHPKDPKIWWVAAVGGGIWHTVDAGESWNNQTDELPAISTTALAICKTSPDILYAGTGEGFYNGDAIIGDGIMKTVNGGQDWTQLSSTAGVSNFRYVNRVIVDPLHPDTVVAATNSGVFRSTDGGDSWKQTFLSGRIQQIIANPLNFSVQYMTYNSNGVYKSIDGGRSWVLVSEEFQPGGRIEIAISPGDTSVLYAAVTGYNYNNGDETSSGLQGLYRSADAGEIWVLLGNTPNWLGKQGWYDNTLAVAPNDPNLLITGGLDLYKIIINPSGPGMSSTRISDWRGWGLPYVHADQHFIVTLANDNGGFDIIVANDGGIHYSKDSGFSWTPRNNGFNVTQYYDGDRGLLDEAYIGGTQDNGTQLSPGPASSSSDWEEVLGGDGFDCAWDKFNPQILYGTLYDTRIYKSTDGGASFMSIDNGIGESDIFHTPLALNPFDSQNLISASDRDTLYLTYDGGYNWHSKYLPFYNSGNVKLSFSAGNEAILWAASNTNTIYVSTDKGGSFNPVNTPLSGGTLYLTGISTSKNEDSTAYISFGVSGYPKIFKTEDLGQSWTNISGDLPNIPVNAVLEMPYDNNEIWAGTDIGLFITKNGGENWVFADDNLPSVAIFRLKIFGKEILAVTHGRGMFTTRNELLPDFKLPDSPPQIQGIQLGNPQSREVLIDFFNRSAHDSIHLVINDSTYKTYGITDMFTFFSESYLPDADELAVKVKVVGYSGANEFVSNIDSLALLNEAAPGFTIDFSESSGIISDDFSVAQPPNFNSPGLHSPHPYSEQYDYIALLKTPVKIKNASGIYYKDVVIVEPGETNAFYPTVEMWDYVTVEGSLDGKTWSILIDPYDSRANSTWLNTYNSGGSGTEAMMVNHKIDLNDYYSDGDIVTIRFRLLSDPAVTGWGWAIDDVVITDQFVGIDGDEGGVAETFNLIGNYPNPFNPGTTIRFSVQRSEPATLEIFNSLGQKVRTLFNNRRFNSATVQNSYWDGKNNSGEVVASGLYIYRLKSGKRSFAKQMLLIK